MPRGVTTLEAIVADVRLETGRSSDRNFGQDEYGAIKNLVQREQERLYWDHDWPFLKVHRDISLQAGSRYYDAPVDLNFERILGVYSQDGTTWLEMERFINANDYNVYDSDNDQRSDPALKWDILLTSAVLTDGGPRAASEQIEIWPLPQTTGKIVRLEGIAKAAVFVSDDDVCTIDNTLLTLFCAAELLARDQRADAPAKLQAANRLYAKMRGSGDARTMGNSFSMAGNTQEKSLYGAKKIIVIAG